ncbi:hypothetical protein [Bradyrhizobium japonicum]|uniref:hypothetical protein n=1 Tax=Bradyrhizobium japonicum TaxID=375 RepID=UPI000419DC70|nr:hypothetical protein [Bradyrhizobium japonicum]
MNFIVWRRGLRGPVASLDLLDPRSMMDWPLIEQSTIAIIPLPEAERGLTLDQAIARHPCPEIVE